MVKFKCLLKQQFMTVQYYSEVIVVQLSEITKFLLSSMNLKVFGFNFFVSAKRD